MSGKTTIEWTDATVNFWWGCTKVGPGCDHCYAETWDKRTGGAHWGPGVSRRGIKGAEATLRRLNRTKPGARVFLQSMSDIFDNEVPKLWFLHAWDTIHDCRNLRPQIVTKRLPMVEKRLTEFAEAFPGRDVWPRHAGLMITVCNQTEADRDIPRLLALKARLGIPWVGLSVEPMLGPMRLDLLARETDGWTYIDDALTGFQATKCGGSHLPNRLDWVICGGESGPHARPMHPDWARSLRDQCVHAGVPFFFKQWGEWEPRRGFACPDDLPRDGWHHFNPECSMRRVGKVRAGRLLDGQEWNQFSGEANA